MLLQVNLFMSKSIKAALLSGLIFPGVGQLSIGHKKRGWFIIIINFILLYLIISEIIQKSRSYIDKMKEEGIEIDIATVSEKTAEIVSFSDNASLNILFLLFILGWTASVIDAYYLTAK